MRAVKVLFLYFVAFVIASCYFQTGIDASPSLSSPANCDPVTGCPAVIAATKFQSHQAFALNNGATNAIVVPEFGRVMAFSSSGESTFNWLWNNSLSDKNQSWQNWGGSKTWLAPQSDWAQIAGAKWPPDSAWTKVIKTEVLTGGFLQTTSALSHSGIRFIHQYGHDESGNFFVKQTAEKISGKPLQSALWSVTQIDPPDAVFFLLNPKSTFRQSVLQVQGKADAQIRQKGDLAWYIPRDQPALKINIDTTAPVLAVLRHNQLFVLRAKTQDAVYPEATEKHPHGFPLAIFDSGVMPQRYLELEFYSPLQLFHQGSARTFTIKWNIYTLSASDLTSPQLWTEVQKILKP
jgi:hypothetical protein